MKPKTTLLPVLLAVVMLVLSACSDGQDDGAAQDSAGMSSQGDASGQAPMGQTPGGMPGQEPDEQTMLLAEYRQIQQRLAEVQEQAMEDPEMQSAFDALEARIEASMQAADPDLDAKRQTMEDLQQEMMEARQVGDQDEMMRIGEEGNALQAEMEQLQLTVIQGEGLAADVAAFRENVQAKMRELEPKTQELLDRAEAIAQEFEKAQAVDENVLPPEPGD